MVQNDELRQAFAQRLKAALKNVGQESWGAGVYLRDVAGVSDKAASKWLNGETMPGRANMLTIAHHLGVRVEWLQYGEGSPSSKDVKDNNVITADFAGRGRLKDGEISIPQYNIRGAMGHGQVPADYIETVRHLTLHESHLIGRGISFSKVENLAVITGWGQSMEGTINDGDPVIIDRGVDAFVGDGVYVFTWDNLLYIKRLQKHSPTQFDMISDNKQHKDQIVNVNEIRIHARVVLVWNAKKL
jgi:phage repressor protein C with HTH and peptisase S24 domain